MNPHTHIPGQQPAPHPSLLSTLQKLSGMGAMVTFSPAIVESAGGHTQKRTVFAVLVRAEIGSEKWRHCQEYVDHDYHHHAFEPLLIHNLAAVAEKLEHLQTEAHQAQQQPAEKPSSENSAP